MIKFYDIIVFLRGDLRLRPDYYAKPCVRAGRRKARRPNFTLGSKGQCMLKKFTDGLIFGAGFAISCLVLLFLASFLILPMFMSKHIEYPTGIEQSNVGAPSPPSIPFHDLGLEEQIKQSSVIALAKFEPARDGQMKAIIKK